MSEEIIVTLTTWSKRIGNLPIVLDTIYQQTVLPDKVVLNLAYDEVVPEDVDQYLNNHGVEVNRVPDTKVYKKIIPTLLKYPDACVINIDDDCLYPHGMIADFMAIHQKHPQYPISGNRMILFGMQCHCGCASLVKAEYFGKFIREFDDDLMQHCSSSDIVYTYFATLNDHPYICSNEQYFENVVQSDLESQSYSEHVIDPGNGIAQAYVYLSNRFGNMQFDASRYIPDDYLSEIVCRIAKMDLEEKLKEKELEGENKIRSTYAFRLGKFVLKPFSFLKAL